jgi:hypothetical protein
LLHNFSIETSFLVDVSSLKKTESGFGPYIQYCHYFQRNYSNIGRSAITVGWKFRFKKFLIGTQYSWIAMANEQILFGEEKTRNFSLNIGYQIAFRGKK